MKIRLCVLGVILVVFSSCASINIVPSSLGGNPDPNNAYYLEDIKVLHQSKISQIRQSQIEKALLYYYQNRKNLTEYIAKQEAVQATNSRLNGGYALSNGIVGGLAGLSSLAALISSWTIIAPIGLGLWNVIGLGIQEMNVKTTIAEGEAKVSQARALADAYNEPRKYWDSLLVNSDGEKETELFNQYMAAINKVNDETSKFLGIPLVR